MATYDEINKEFEPQRQRAQQAVNANTQARRDAITRRMAQLGGGPSGAGIKAEQQAIQEGGQQLAQANEAIDTAARGEFRRVKEIDDARAFAKSEREASQAFGASEAEKGRSFARGERLGSQEFARGERLGGQEFAAGQADLQRKFVTGEREATQGWQSGEAELARRFNAAESFYARELQEKLFKKQFALEIERFEHEKYIDEKNIDFNNRMLAKKDILERMLSPFLGDEGGGGMFGGGGWRGDALNFATGGMLNPMGSAGAAFSSARSKGWL